jgi:hypothetical protein
MGSNIVLEDVKIHPKTSRTRFTLMMIGIPCNGPRVFPAALSWSSDLAVASSRSLGLSGSWHVVCHRVSQFEPGTGLQGQNSSRRHFQAASADLEHQSWGHLQPSRSWLNSHRGGTSKNAGQWLLQWPPTGF